ncbi:MAG: NUDIX domain-containing protein [Chitinophagia bacterium]|jgi:8-oxo-dGTP pyrophosphatase MutT (NUDIX family)
MNNQQIIEAGGGLVLNERGYLLMIYRRGYWDLPKGKRDPGEAIETCAVREVEEETGLSEVQLLKPVGETVHHYHDPFTNLPTQKITYWYSMYATSSQPLIPQSSEDITDIRWVSATELPHLLEQSFPTIREIIGKAGLLHS